MPRGYLSAQSLLKHGNQHILGIERQADAAGSASIIQRGCNCSQLPGTMLRAPWMTARPICMQRLRWIPGSHFHDASLGDT